MIEPDVKFEKISQNLRIRSVLRHHGDKLWFPHDIDTKNMEKRTRLGK